jgi:hypothetical protein
MIDSKKKIVGILALYYPEYEKNSVAVFRNFLRQINPNYKLFIINNNFNIIKNKYIPGSNSQNEFSAWQEGIELTKKKKISNVNLWIFANDTFCNHRRFDLLNSFIFRRKFLNAFSCDKPTCAGDIHHIPKRFIYKNIRMNYWISTYLFAISNSGMKMLNYRLNKAPRNRKDLSCFDKLDKSLKSHLLESINKDGKGNNWKKHFNLDFQATYNKKINSMINEIDLSSRMVSLNFNFIKVFDNSWYKFLWRLRDLLIYG